MIVKTMRLFMPEFQIDFRGFGRVGVDQRIGFGSTGRSSLRHARECPQNRFSATLLFSEWVGKGESTTIISAIGSQRANSACVHEVQPGRILGLRKPDLLISRIWGLESILRDFA
jgi:hypothetical protein